MSKYSKGYMGEQIGKLGPAVGRKWRGIAYMAAYQKNVSNPNTEDQQLVRARFRSLTALMHAFRQAITLGYGAVAARRGMTECNMFVKRNWLRVTAIDPADVQVAYSGLQVSEGNLPCVTFGAADFGGATHLTISVAMEGNSDVPDADAEDKVYLFAYCPDNGQGVLGSPALRSASEVSVTVPGSWDGLTVHVYGFAVGTKEDVNKGWRSNSAYCGTGEMS